MSDLPAIVGVGGTFQAALPKLDKDGKVVIVDDKPVMQTKTYRWLPLTIGALGALEVELRLAIADRLDMIGPAAKACDDAKLTGDDRKTALEAAMHEHLRLRRLGPFALIEELNIPDSNAIMLKHLLLPSHPDITLDEVRLLTALPIYVTISTIILEQMRAMLPGKDKRPAAAASLASHQTTTTMAAQIGAKKPKPVKAGSAGRRSSNT